jgi:hypothetical protein
MKKYQKIILTAFVVAALYAGFHFTMAHNPRSWSPLWKMLFANALAGIIFNIILWVGIVIIVFTWLKKIFRKT